MNRSTKCSLYVYTNKIAGALTKSTITGYENCRRTQIFAFQRYCPLWFEKCAFVYDYNQWPLCLPIYQDNILIGQDGVPLLSDFGISRIVENSITVTGTSSLNGNARWMSIELFDPSILEDSSRNHELHTKRSDVWAYGMVVYVSDTLGFDFV